MFLSIQKQTGRCHTLRRYPLDNRMNYPHFGIDDRIEIDLAATGVQIPLEIIIGQLIAGLEHAVLLAMLLHGIIGQMDHGVFEVVQVEVLA
jgi:hypothetical protein